jgi:hypothetical protein
MRSIVTVAVVATCGLTGSAASAAQRQALCKFVVEGRTYINGQCSLEVDADGSFRIWDNAHTVYVNVDGSTAEASWNKNPKSLHAYSSLGTLARNGACWGNATTQICARDLPAVK